MCCYNCVIHSFPKRQLLELVLLVHTKGFFYISPSWSVPLTAQLSEGHEETDCTCECWADQARTAQYAPNQNLLLHAAGTRT